MSQIERYKKLGYRDSIPRVHRYPSACKELSFILRAAYSKFPKNLQALIFQDVLEAFRLLPLPGMQTSNAISAAHLLVQSAEAALPKQKKNMAATEFKQAMVAHKRRCKARQEEERVSGSVQLPQDVLAHIFGLLDLQSLVSVALVNWTWNLAASDDQLWCLQYNTFFGNSDYSWKSRAQKDKKHGSVQEDIGTGTSIDWKEAFKRSYRGKSSKNLTSSRGYCGNCRGIVWLDNTKCSNEHCQLHFDNQQVRPVSPSQVVEYILDGSVTISSSDSESDSEEVSRPMSKYWAFPVFQ